MSRASTNYKLQTTNSRMITWQQLYSFLGITDFIYFISNPAIQDTLFPIKLVFILFTVFFFCAVIYFYLNSSYLQYQFLQDVSEFFSWQAYGLRSIDKQWKSIVKKTDSGNEKDFKLAVIEADDFLYSVLEDRGFKGETFEELLNSAGRRMLPNLQDILDAHAVRDSIVFNPDYNLDVVDAKRMLANYESVIKNLSVG